MQANSAEEQKIMIAPTTRVLGVTSGLVDNPSWVDHQTLDDQAFEQQPFDNQTFIEGYMAGTDGVASIATDISPDRHPPIDASTNLAIAQMPDAIAPDETMGDRTCFHGDFASCMEMYASAQQVGAYLDAHREWFPRCAHPMRVAAIGENGYDLLIGKFGSFGYEVEARIGLDLLPGEAGVYRIETIPVPGYESVGYEVDFQAALELVEIASDSPLFPKLMKGMTASDLPAQVTRVEWELHLQVTVQFPRFIQALPQNLIQTTGDRLLNQIVRQVSRCLTQKVQDDFHASLGLSFPKKRKFGFRGKD